jgi:hypothetical protein
VGKGKRVDVYLEVRKRRGHIFFEWNKCLWYGCLQRTYSFYSSHLIYLVKFGILVCPFMWMRVFCMCLKIMWMVVILYALLCEC